MTSPATTVRRAWIGLAVLALPTLLLSLDMSVLYLALPALSADLGLGPTAQLWAMDVYGFMIAGFLVTMGTLGDRIGRRRLLLIGAGAFGVASVAAAFSTGPAMLIATRALLGVAGATLMPSTLGLIRTMFPDPRARGTAISVWMSCFMGGMTIGPLVGGALLETFWWGAAFLMGVPVMVLLLVVGPVLLPESRDAGAGRLDLASVALSLGAVLPVVHGLKSLAADGPTLGAVAALVLGAGLGTVFVRRQLRLDDPLLDLRLFRRRATAGALGINVGGGVVMAGTFLLLTLWLQLVDGMSVLTVGLVLAPLQAAMVIASLSAPRLARSVRPARVMAAGLLIGAVGLAVVGLLGAGAGGGTVVLLGGFLLAAVGIALPTALGTDLLVGSVPEEKAGSAGALSETSGELGVALGVATLGSLATAVYRDVLVVPPGTPAPLADAARAGLTEAVAAGPTSALLDAVRTAFTTGLGVAATVGAVVFAGLAGLALYALGGVPVTPAAPVDKETATETARETAPEKTPVEDDPVAAAA
ncbi:MFS transporter [Actinomycetospora sp. NBRC 106375]|uniref:MFS transporter n=1 Tax=Actinomycetospora sp. NBRC 106375 TaxID=3032207 RepID=UPI0024A5CDE0|nr:MFS transporter [Actinomycetospora sp. NBRC 106375]GLZ50295.1 MFS transporter [Actinomycetospora sp. NBRC 106375]